MSKKYQVSLIVIALATLLLAGCGSVRTSSAVRQQIETEEDRLPDIREQARLGIDRGEKMVKEGLSIPQQTGFATVDHIIRNWFPKGTSAPLSRRAPGHPLYHGSE